ncbi:hypothetical protein C5E41_21330 [Nocardia nova]|nr:hypothetical protein C5E41_21330 [Nocardia nova]
MKRFYRSASRLPKNVEEAFAIPVVAEVLTRCPARSQDQHRILVEVGTVPQECRSAGVVGHWPADGATTGALDTPRARGYPGAQLSSEIVAGKGLQYILTAVR